MRINVGSGLYEFTNNDGGFERLVLNGAGDLSLFLRPDHGIAMGRANHCIGQLIPTFPLAQADVLFLFDHFTELEKNVRMTIPGGGNSSVDFSLTLFKLLT